MGNGNEETEKLLVLSWNKIQTSYFPTVADVAPLNVPLSSLQCF